MWINRLTQWIFFTTDTWRHLHIFFFFSKSQLRISNPVKRAQKNRIVEKNCVVVKQMNGAVRDMCMNVQCNGIRERGNLGVSRWNDGWWCVWRVDLCRLMMLLRWSTSSLYVVCSSNLSQKTCLSPKKIPQSLSLKFELWWCHRLANCPRVRRSKDNRKRRQPMRRFGKRKRRERWGRRPGSESVMSHNGGRWWS